MAGQKEPYRSSSTSRMLKLKLSRFAFVLLRSQKIRRKRVTMGKAEQWFIGLSDGFESEEEAKKALEAFEEEYVIPSELCTVFGIAVFDD
jgi:hypothetical protein